MESRIDTPEELAPVFVNRPHGVAPVEEGRSQEQIRVEIWSQANEEKGKLFVLMENARARLDKGRTTSIQPAKLNLSRCTWDEVMQEVQATATGWSTTSKRTSKVMQCLDKLGRNSDAFRSWLQLLPAGDYGSSICGVFALAFGAAGQYIEVEDTILEALVEIPGNYRGCPESILRALTHIMRFFADSSLRKVYQPILKQSAYKSELLASLEDVKTQASRIKEEANQCMQQRLMEMDQNLLNQGNILLDTNQSSAHSLQVLENIYKLLLNTKGLRIPNSDSNPEEVRSRHLEPGSVFRKVIEYPATDDADQHTERAKEVLELLQFHPEVVSKDIETSLRLGDAMDENQQARAASLIRNQIFKTYISGNSSSAALLVNGNEDLSCAEGISPLSVVAARLASVPEQTGYGFVLKYFCGEHRPYTGQSLASSPIGMMASLVGQLISQMLDKIVEVDLSFLTKADWANLKKLKLRVLYIIFQELVKQLPPTSLLLCILDEINLYETGALRDDANIVSRRLTRLAKKRNDIIFKLLVTCRGRAFEIGQYFDGHILELDETAEPEDSSNWNIVSMAV